MRRLHSTDWWIIWIKKYNLSGDFFTSVGIYVTNQQQLEWKRKIVAQKDQKDLLSGTWFLLSLSVFRSLDVYVRGKNTGVKGPAHINRDHASRQSGKASVTCTGPGALSIIISAEHSQRKACPSEYRTTSVSALSCRDLTLLFAWLPSPSDMWQFRVKNTTHINTYTYTAHAYKHTPTDCDSLESVDLMSETDCMSN